MSSIPYRAGVHFLRTNFPEYPLSHYERTRAFTGKPTGPIPKDMKGTTAMGGIIVKLVEAHPSRRLHRIFAECPKCRNDVPAGRLHQHVGTCVGITE